MALRNEQITEPVIEVVSNHWQDYTVRQLEMAINHIFNQVSLYDSMQSDKLKAEFPNFKRDPNVEITLNDGSGLFFALYGDAGNYWFYKAEAGDQLIPSYKKTLKINSDIKAIFKKNGLISIASLDVVVRLLDREESEFLQKRRGFVEANSENRELLKIFNTVLDLQAYSLSRFGNIGCVRSRVKNAVADGTIEKTNESKAVVNEKVRALNKLIHKYFILSALNDQPSLRAEEKFFLANMLLINELSKVNDTEYREPVKAAAKRVDHKVSMEEGHGLSSIVSRADVKTNYAECTKELGKTLGR